MTSPDSQRRSTGDLVPGMYRRGPDPDRPGHDYRCPHICCGGPLHSLWCPPDQIPAEGQTIYCHAIHARSKADYKIDANTGCWEWQKAFQPNGYPAGKPKPHRAYFQRANPGVDITGLDIHHKCHNQRCVNPDHLEAVDHSFHLRRHRWADSAVLTPAQVAEIKHSPLTAKQLGAKFGVKWKTVENVRYGRNWKDIGGEYVKPARDCPFCGAAIGPERKRNTIYCDPTCARKARKRKLTQC